MVIYTHMCVFICVCVYNLIFQASTEGLRMFLLRVRGDYCTFFFLPSVIPLFTLHSLCLSLFFSLFMTLLLVKKKLLMFNK